MTLKRAFEGKSLPALVVKILRGGVPQIPGRYSAELRALAHSMLAQSPDQRPAVGAILRLPWMRQHLERYAGHMMHVSCKELTSLSALSAVSKADRSVRVAPKPLSAADLPSAPPEQHQNLPSEGAFSSSRFACVSVPGP